MVACLLWSRVVTLVPRADADGLSGPERDRLGELLEAWAWAWPLLGEGIVGSDDALADAARIESERLMRSGAPVPTEAGRTLVRDGSVDIEAFVRDVIRGGVHPGICLPIDGALSACAAAWGVPMARSSGGGLAQQSAEARAKPFSRVLLPSLRSPDAEVLMEARGWFTEPASRLEAALAALSTDAEVCDGAEVSRMLAPIATELRDVAADHRTLLDPASGTRLVLVRADLSVCDAESPVGVVERLARRSTGRRGLKDAPAATDQALDVVRPVLTLTVSPTRIDL